MSDAVAVVHHHFTKVESDGSLTTHLLTFGVDTAAADIVAKTDLGFTHVGEWTDALPEPIV
jgi:hypothetical protein